MLGILELLKKRPSDRTIRIIRIVFGLILIITSYYSLVYSGNREIQDTLFGQSLGESGKSIIKYMVVSLGIIPIFMGLTNICLLKSKYIRIMQILFGITLFFISFIIKDIPVLGIDTLFGIMGVIPLLGGISGKLITKTCLRYGEKVTKIRV